VNLHDMVLGTAPRAEVSVVLPERPNRLAVRRDDVGCVVSPGRLDHNSQADKALGANRVHGIFFLVEVDDLHGQVCRDGSSVPRAGGSVRVHHAPGEAGSVTVVVDLNAVHFVLPCCW